MIAGARVQAAIDCLDLIAAAARDNGAAADTIIARYFSTRRYAGSKDRRAVRDLIYDVVRSIGDRPASGRGALIGHAKAFAPELLTLFGGDGHVPAVLAEREIASTPSLAPGWLTERLERRFGKRTQVELAALLGRAPLDLRVNTLATTRDEVLADMTGVVATPYAATGLRATEPLAVDQHPAFHAGLIEVQDEGSQIAASVAGAKPGMTVVDLCAGAGGKTLALAAAMENEGRLLAVDTDRGRLDRMGPRLERAGVTIVERRLLDPGQEWEKLSDLSGKADLVLIDAPCSGTGTWRRNPEARWRLTPDRLDRLGAEQARLLALGARLVKPGGTLVYIVCSLLPEEGEAQVAAFRRGQPKWSPKLFANPVNENETAELVLTPAAHGCDGFYIAQLIVV